MITRRKIEIFKKFNGDIDHLARVGTTNDKLDISDKDWALIDSLLQDIELVNKGFASNSFARNLDIRIKENVESEITLKELKSINTK